MAKGKSHLAGRETRESVAEENVVEMPAPEQQQSMSMEDQDQAVVEAGGEPRVPSGQINRGLIAVEFLPPKPRVHKGDRFMLLPFSVSLIEEHLKYFPNQIKEWYEVVHDESRHVPFICIDVPPVTVEIYPYPEQEEPSIKVIGTTLESVALELIEEKGKGETRLVVRLSFMVPIPDGPYFDWAVHNFGGAIWIRIARAQGDLLNG